MSKTVKPLTVRKLREILNSIPEDMITDALVLVFHKRGKQEYSITRVGQFTAIPNLTLTIVPNTYGLVLDEGEAGE